MARVREDRSGEAGVELVAAIPVLFVVTLLVAQFAVAGYVLWSAGAASRAGARAAYVEGDAKAAARSPLPSPLRDGAIIKDGDGVSVRVRAPSPVPGIPAVPVTARSELGVGDGPSG